jgi:hypothetical protein
MKHLPCLALMIAVVAAVGQETSDPARPPLPSIASACAEQDSAIHAQLLAELRRLRREVWELRVEAQLTRTSAVERALDEVRAGRRKLQAEEQALTLQMQRLESQLASAPAGSEERLRLEIERAEQGPTDLERIRSAQIVLAGQESEVERRLLAEQQRLELLQRTGNTLPN